MATAIAKAQCSICNDKEDTYECKGCLQIFCFNHLKDHRETINKQFNQIEDDYNSFRQTLFDQKEDPIKSSLIRKVDQWEEESINKIKKTAEQCRQNLINYTNQFHIEIENKLNDIANELKQIRKNNKFNEIDINKFKENLNKLKKELDKPSNISIKQESSTFINKILVTLQFDKDFVRLENRIDERRNKMTSDIAGSTGSLKTSTKRQFFVRAEFDYDSSRDPSLPGGPGLTFRTGNILYVTNAADDSWWQAKHVTNGHDEEELGIIPSKSRVEKRERTRQKRVNFNQGSHSRSNKLDRDKKKKKKFGIFNKSGDRKDAQPGEDSENEPENSEPVASYELVTQHEIDYARPIIIFGPFKEILNDQLRDDRPDKFVNCVPHTSRSKRDQEVNGREYHFVSTREQMKRDIQNHLFIEAGEYGGHLYGTSLNAVREVATNSKHCILDVSGRAIQRLIVGGLYPIVIYVKARDVKWILSNMEEEANEELAQQIFEKSNKLKEEFGNLFTVTIEEDTLSDVYDRICKIIDHEETVQHAWIPSKEKI